MKIYIFLAAALVFSINTVISQGKFETSPLLNGIGMNAILSHSKDFKTTKKIKNGDTLVVYKLNDDHFTFLGQSVSDIEVHSKNNLVILIAFPIETRIMDAPNFPIQLPKPKAKKMLKLLWMLPMEFRKQGTT